ncbi:MAG TPA: phosphopantheine-transferase PgaX, partial [Streptomyces sp.]|nr:phosphopantheine-transferase PgaX [Streptomyces sp.]
MRSDGLLDVWLLQVPRDKASADRLARSELDDRERARAASFRREPDALLYVCAHIALRRILGSYLGIGPRDVRLARAPCGTCGAPHGRPTVEAPSPGLHFSLSHSGGMALVAVASSTVGADVQLLPAVRTVVG